MEKYNGKEEFVRRMGNVLREAYRCIDQVYYIKDGFEEFVIVDCGYGQGEVKICVTCDSLSAILHDVESKLHEVL